MWWLVLDWAAEVGAETDRFLSKQLGGVDITVMARCLLSTRCWERMTQGNRTVGIVGEQITSKAARSLRCVLLLLLLVTASPLRAHAQMETLKSIGRWFYDPWGLGDAIGRGGSSLYLSANNATVSGRVAQGIQSRRNSDMLAELAANPNGAAIHRPRSDQSAAVAAELPVLAAGAADVVEGVLAASEMYGAGKIAGMGARKAFSRATRCGGKVLELADDALVATRKGAQLDLSKVSADPNSIIVFVKNGKSPHLSLAVPTGNSSGRFFLHNWGIGAKRSSPLLTVSFVEGKMGFIIKLSEDALKDLGGHIAKTDRALSCADGIMEVLRKAQVPFVGRFSSPIPSEVLKRALLSNADNITFFHAKGVNPWSEISKVTLKEIFIPGVIFGPAYATLKVMDYFYPSAAVKDER